MTDLEAVSKANAFKDVLRRWVKTWFFDLETKAEYDDSKNCCLEWIDEEIRLGKVGGLMGSKAKKWIKDLDSRSSYWANYSRLYTSGMDQRCTSIGEQMHWHIKSGHNGVKSSMSTATAAVNILTKSKRRTDDFSQSNAYQCLRKKLWTVADEVQQYLIDHAASETQIQIDLANFCKVIHVKRDMFFVLDNKEAILRHRRKLPEVIPEYERLRQVEIVKDKYESCTCGYPARLKRPCSHVIAVFGGISFSMFGVRWFSGYQHNFQREDEDEKSSLFRVIENKEFKRDMENGEYVLVEGLINFEGGNDFPRLLSNATQDNLKFSVTLYEQLFKKKL